MTPPERARGVPWQGLPSNSIGVTSQLSLFHKYLFTAAGVEETGTSSEFSLSLHTHTHPFTASVLPRQVPGGLRQLHLTEWPRGPT